MSQFMSGIQQTVINDKIRKGGSLNEGKRPMSFQTYENICELLYVGGDDEYLFTNAFLAVEWNLMAQSDNCVNTCLNRVLRQDDCLLLFFGENLKEIRLDILQRNPGTFIRDPNSPHLCPVLSLKKIFLVTLTC